jgi:uncharacterized RDD family membrane protein YckC
MVNDSVREECESTLTPLATPVTFHFVEERADSVPRPAVPPEPRLAVSAEAKPVVSTPKQIARRSVTGDLAAKKTSPTLAEFKNKNASVPDWRLQLQNSVRQRAGRADAEPVAANAVSPGAGASRGANALKVQYAPEPEVENQVDLKVANALKRIEQSRRRYLPTEKAREGMRVAKAAASRNYPFNVVSRSADLPERPAAPAEPPTTVRPRLVSSMKIEKKAYDTNKLVPIPEAAYLAADVETTGETAEPKVRLKENWSQKIEIRESKAIEETPAVELAMDAETETDEIDDLAPISMRFNAGLFDLIIGGFASFVLFSPFLGLYEGWTSLSGLLLFTSILLVVMFVYLTASIAFLGHTFGMKLFSLELVDAEQSEFPTLHQAAVNSSVYLLSLFLGGLGFVPLFFNEEKRAAHDLISGTILVRGI